MGSRHHPKRYLRRRVGAQRAQRLAALVSLALDVVGLALIVALVIERPLWAVGLLALALAFVALTFVSVTSSSVRRVASGAGAAAALILLFLGVVLWQADRGDRSIGWQGPAAIVALVAGAFLQRHALQVPPPSSPKLFQVRPGERPACAQGVLFVNPNSGGGKAEDFDLRDEASSLGVEVVTLTEGDDLEALARSAAADGADALGMAGGDGSLAVVAQVAVDHDVPFICVPAGTRNHFALDIGLDRDDPRQALSAFVTGEERRLDYATVNGRMFLNNVALGVYAAIVEHPDYRDAKLGTTLELLPKLTDEGGHWFDLSFDVPDHGHVESTTLLMVSNGAYEVNGDFGRRRRLDGGELGVITVDPHHVGELVSLTVLAAAGRAQSSKALWAWTTPAFEVSSSQERVPAGVDGETVELRAPLSFETVPGGLRVLVPRGTRVGLDEQHRGAKGRYSGLFEVAFGSPGG